MEQGALTAGQGSLFHVLFFISILVKRTHFSPRCRAVLPAIAENCVYRSVYKLKASTR